MPVEGGIDNVWEDSSTFGKIKTGDYLNLCVANGQLVSWGAGVLGRDTELYESKIYRVNGLNSVSNYGVNGSTSWAVNENQMKLWGYFNGRKALSPVNVFIPKEGRIERAFVNSKFVVALLNDGVKLICVVLGYPTTIISDHPLEFPYSPKYLNIPLITSKLELSIIKEFDANEMKDFRAIGSSLLILKKDGKLCTMALNDPNAQELAIPFMEKIGKVKMIDASRNSVIISTENGDVFTWTGVSPIYKSEALSTLFWDLFKSDVRIRQTDKPGISLLTCILNEEPTFVGRYDVIDLAAGWDHFIIASK